MIRPNLYDYLKLFAIVTMIIDHIGYFLFPDIMELRMIGRRAFPVFFFLIGRNGSSRIPHSLMFRACFIQGVLRGTSYLQGYDLRQLNILPVAILVKLFLGYMHTYHKNIIPSNSTKELTIEVEESSDLENKVLSNDNMLLIFLTVFTTLSPLGKGIMEYGLMGFAMAIFGYIVKQKKIIGSKGVTLAALISLIGCIVINHQFPFNAIQWIIVICGWFVIGYIVCTRDLYSDPTGTGLDPSTRPARGFQGSVGMMMLWISNNAVWIYVIHFSLLLSIVIMRKS